MTEKLEERGIRTCGELLGADHGVLTRLLGPKVAGKLRAFASGRDPREWQQRPPRRSVGAQARVVPSACAGKEETEEGDGGREGERETEGDGGREKVGEGGWA